MTAHEHKKLTRLYLPDTSISAGEDFILPENQHHYVRNVMRLEAGESLRVFNGLDGEWLAILKEVSKKKAVISFAKKLREQEALPDILILTSPVKKEVFDLMIEKACELGASTFQPVITEHSSIHKINEDRLQFIATEAAEQCERLSVMKVEALTDLKAVLNSWDKSKKLIFCIERKDMPAMIHSLIAGDLGPSIGILIGPEGGFSDAEVDYISALDFVVPVSLGPNVLKTETAMISALLCLQAVGGIRAKMDAQKAALA